jgi:DNA polymerase III epsilon subunit-like protein
MIAPMLADAVLVAANVGFDAAFLDRFLRRNGNAPAWNYHLAEVESYAAGVLGVDPPWKLDRFLDAFGIKVSEDQRHTALGDALAVRDLWDACHDPARVADARAPRGSIR